MPLKEGDVAPTFTAEDQNGVVVDSEGLRGKRFVIYFYPKDDTYFCTQEACTFQMGIEAFQELGVPVIGISPDSAGSHKRFAEKHGLTFSLLSDRPRNIIKAYEAEGLLGRTTRVTYVVGPDGRIEGVRRHELSGRGHADWAADVVRQHAAATVPR